jgi:antitoxin ParD1/3/4
MASSVNLGEQLEAFITEVVKTGRYGSRSEVLREGVRLVQEREAKWARFDSEIRKGMESLDRGEGVPLGDAFRDARAAVAAKRDGRKDAA